MKSSRCEKIGAVAALALVVPPGCRGGATRHHSALGGVVVSNTPGATTLAVAHNADTGINAPPPLRCKRTPAAPHPAPDSRGRH